MLYYLTTQNDMMIPMNCMREQIMPDVILLWDMPGEASKIESIGNDDDVILAIRDAQICDFLTKILLTNGVEKGHIIDFYRIFNVSLPYNRVDRVMSNPFVQKYEGIILGLSHAEVGILPDVLEHPLANLAVSSQDLYYSLAAFKYAVEKYPAAFDLNYLVLDMYNYNYFNFDTSLSKVAPAYLFRYGGVDWDSHHYEDNGNVSLSFEKYRSYMLEERYGFLDPKSLEKFDSFFDLSADREERYSYYYGYPEMVDRNRVISDELVDLFCERNSRPHKRHEDTVKENREIFRRILELAYGINPNVSVHVMLMPYYGKAWHSLQENPYLSWKEEFERIISEYRRKFPFIYHDLIDSAISKEKICWYDPEHLNYYGAIRFTRELNGILFH